jgi:hypothetical protein
MSVILCTSMSTGSSLVKTFSRAITLISILFKSLFLSLVCFSEV